MSITPPPPSTLPPVWRWLRRGFVVLAVAAVGWALWVSWDLEAFLAWREEAGPLPFFAALAVLPAVGVPTTPFYILAGATFGVWGGLVGSALSLGLNLLLCYWIARSGLRRWIERLLANTRFNLPVLPREQLIRFALLVKFAPGAPTVVKTYLIAIVGVPFPIYFGLSFSVTMLYAAGFIVLGESMLERDFGQAGWAIAALLALAVVIWGGRAS